MNVTDLIDSRLYGKGIVIKDGKDMFGCQTVFVYYFRLGIIHEQAVDDIRLLNEGR